ELRYGDECTDGSECFGARCVESQGGGACTYVCEEQADCPSGTACLRVMGREERVCAAPAGGSGCSVSGGRTMPVGLVFLALLALALLVGRSKRALGSLGVVLALTLTACGSSHVEEDGGRRSHDAGVMDAAA